jgi:hypothetical protein
MRFPDWQSRFSKVVKDYQRSAFEWGVHDCCLFVCDCIVALTGQDPAAEFRGKYDNEEQARQLVQDYCGGGIEDLVTVMSERFGYPEISPISAQRGDLGLITAWSSSVNFSATMGICVGGQFAFMGLGEMKYVPYGLVARAWRVA